MYNELHNGCIITFYSSTHMQRARLLLEDAGVRAEETRPPSGLTGGSCAYALRIQRRDIQTARHVLAKTRYGAIFCMMNGGYRKV